MSYVYDVALSFAGEDREYVEDFALELQKYNIKVFYDKFEEATLWGKDLYTYLSDIYSKKAKYCIIFVSKSYAKKQWTKLERESAQERAFKENIEYILPVRLDDTSIPGIKETTGYISAQRTSPKQLCQTLLEKLERNELLTNENAVLRFNKNYTLDGDFLFKSLEKYNSWDSVNIENHIPVSILFPFEVEQRISSYKSILDNTKPSISIPEDTIKQCREIYSEEYISNYIVDRLEKAIRKLYSFYVSNLISKHEFLEISSIYSQSKLINLIRNILAYRLEGTEDESWLRSFYNLSGSYHENIMSGLPYVLKNQFQDDQLLFWTQIDLLEESRNVLNPTHIRHLLYLPDNLIMNLDYHANLKDHRSSLLKYLVPQLIEHGFNRNDNFNLYFFIKYPDNYSISIRAEWFYKTDSFNQIGQTWERKELKAQLLELDSFQNLDNRKKFKLESILR